MGFKPRYAIGELVILKRRAEGSPENVLYISKRMPQIVDFSAAWSYSGKVYSVEFGPNLSFKYSSTINWISEEDLSPLESRLTGPKPRK